MKKTQTFSNIDDFLTYLRISGGSYLSEIRVLRIEESTHSNFLWNTDPIKGLFYQLSFSESFQGNLVKDQKKVMPRGAFIGFVSPMHTVIMEAQPARWLGYALFFSLDFTEFSLWNSQTRRDFPFLFEESAPALPITEHARKEQYRSLFQSLYAIYHSDLENRRALLQAGLRDLIGQIQEDYPLLTSAQAPPSGSPQRVLASQFIKMANHRFADLHQARVYAAALGVTYDQLHYSVKKYWGRSPFEVLRAKLLVEAKILLEQTSLSISEIAHHLNFEEPSHFSRFFKRHTGLSPTEYLSQKFSK